MATLSKCTPGAAARQLLAHLAETTAFFPLWCDSTPAISFMYGRPLIWPVCLPQPLQEAANQTLFTPYISSPTTSPANSVISVSPHRSSLFTVFHLAFRPSHAFVTPANPTHSELPTWATLQFRCTLYHSYCIINFKCKACLAFGFLVFQIFLETQQKMFYKALCLMFLFSPHQISQSRLVHSNHQQNSNTEYLYLHFKALILSVQRYLYSLVQHLKRTLFTVCQ